ncbi:MAG: hypothetical protein PWP56_1759 [Acetobacterium sp.]|jgi:hypothetical protein|uniref:rRNA biogenesis protein rrp5 n=1 Tax=Acetobacterium sp. K1/6 TaxID=3055467 RepID=UPI0029E7BFD0|nr:rRNA biogenesis protein rrp5 [Acetobacterium sp. K1/6]MDK2942246.1 hypothetical protein [Acetobacterium sp.]MDZ5723475.1 rRNA biogenesis protein rrp5 [Acetobacterium sp. K1/6]
MSRVKLLLDVISDVRTLADSLQAIADAMIEDKSEPAEVNKKKETAQEDKLHNKNSTTKSEFSLEDVRVILAQKSQNGFTTEVRDLIQKYGGSRLSEIDPVNYGNIITEAEVLGE